ncbi:hypothetical protein [Planomonospora sp. ID82291]|uniref:hypothetical protein n=1 Tax=Planomonospora sp. ID82291 TaxID=2738136 RepID=UPI0018C3B2A9|nr:hypothetical protein [Planomonospora sp. ID82291]MBG0817428.1 hypothetical protein [Planomonospora sp. ID82291]
MSGEGYRTLLDCRRRAEALRARSFTFDQIADVLALDHPVSPLRLYRYAHGRTAADVVAAYNDLDPAGTACLREARLYDYEAWPQTGRRAPARSIAIFARVYRTTARRLLTAEVYASYGVRDRDLLDRADHRHLDPHHRRRPAPAPGTAPPLASPPVPATAPGTALTTGSPGVTGSPFCGQVSVPGIRGSMEPEAARARVPAPGPADCAELLRALSAEEADVRRRELLFELALVLGGTPALALLRHLTPPERERLAAAARRRGPLDPGALDLLERLTARLWAMDESHGPAQVLPTAEAERTLVADLLTQASLTPALRDRLLRLYWALSLIAGWSGFDLMDYTGAARRYHEGLAAAHELRSPAHIAHLHGLLAHMALHQKKPTIALDHAFAAEGWARESGNRLQQAATSIQVARVLSTVKRDENSLRLLDRATDLAGSSRGRSDLQHLSWLTPDCVAAHGTSCLIDLKRTDRAISEVKQRLATMDSGLLRERGILQLRYATALVQKREIPEAAAMIGKAAQIVTAHSSTRLAHAVRQTRAELQPWAENRRVRDLDEHLRALSIIDHSSR